MGEELKDLSCPFCRPEIIKPETLVESEHFLLKVPLGAVAEGHVLIITKLHYRCLGAAPRKVIEDFLAFKRRIETLLHTIYEAPVMIYEYGKWGQSVPHAHVHLIPSKTNRFAVSSLIKEMIETGGFKCSPIDYFDLIDKYEHDGCYVAIEERSQLFYCDVSHVVGQQNNPHLNHREFFATYKGCTDIRDWSKMTAAQLDEDAQRRKATRTKLLEQLNASASSS